MSDCLTLCAKMIYPTQSLIDTSFSLVTHNLTITSLIGSAVLTSKCQGNRFR